MINEYNLYGLDRVDEAKKLIGRKGYFSYTYTGIEEQIKERKHIYTLKAVNNRFLFPYQYDFLGRSNASYFYLMQ